MMPEQASRPQLIFNTTADEPIAVLAITSKDRPNDEFETRLGLKRWAEQVLSRRLEQAEGIAQVVPVGAVEPEVQIRYLPARNRPVRPLSESGTELGERRQYLYLKRGDPRRLVPLLHEDREPDPRTGRPGKSAAHTARAGTYPHTRRNRRGTPRRNRSHLLRHSRGRTCTQPAGEKRVWQQHGGGVRHPDAAGGGDARTLSQYQIEVLREDATFIRKAIQNLLQTLLIGGILAFFVLFAFLNDIRTPFTIGVAIPVSIFITFFVMYGSGIQLNIVSLSGLTLGIGLLLDNAIVVLENINRHMPLAPSVKRAAAVGTKEIALAVTASTFTTISVFLPLIFLGGFEGAFFQDQAWTLSISCLPPSLWL
jgi:hydrophobic/amphiphilic exporter-1 (mainly G- bacteria), HAE1 family